MVGAGEAQGSIPGVLNPAVPVARDGPRALVAAFEATMACKSSGKALAHPTQASPCCAGRLACAAHQFLSPVVHTGCAVSER